MRAYLDHAATSPMRAEAVAAVTAELTRTGNPSSVHGSGRAARRVVEDARDLIDDPVISLVDRTFLLWVFAGFAMAFGLGYAIGGTLDAGPGEDGGFSVRVTLPLPLPAPSGRPVAAPATGEPAARA